MFLALFARKTTLSTFPLHTLSRAVSNYGSLDSPLVNPAFIDVAMSQLLKNKKAKKSDMNEFIEHFKTRMNKQNFISLLRGCRRRHVLEPKHIYTAACGLKFADDAPLNNAQLVQIFESISYMSHRIASVRVLITVTSDALQACEEHFTVEQIANFMFSLVHMKSGVPEVREMVNTLMVKLSACESAISNDSASKLIGGFRGLRLKYPEVQQALGAVLEKLEKHSDSSAFSEGELTRALFGIKRLTSDHADTRRLTAYILSKVGSCQLNSWHLSQAIYAVQSMDTDAAETKALFQFLIQQVEQLNDESPLISSNVNDVLTSLGVARTNTDEISNLASALRLKIA